MLKNIFTKDRIVLFFKGMAMGAADSVPGVSGGTIAFITGIYEELINSIQSVNINALKVLFRSGPHSAWQHINGSFLFTLLLGLIAAVVLFANAVVFLLQNYPQFIMSFFIGLIIASCWYMYTKIESWDFKSVCLTMLGLFCSISLAMVPQTSLEPSLLYIFFCAAVAICAMILPGISGAFILILLGAYEPVLGAVKNLDLVTLTVFVAGCATGLIAFSNLLKYLFDHFKNLTLAFLLGILAGSLYTIWPWRLPLNSVANDGEHVTVLYENLSPFAYSDATGIEVNLYLCLILAVSGFVLIYGLERFAASSK